MSEETVEILRQIFTLVSDRGIVAATAAFGDLLDPAFELEEASNVPDRERHSGREAFIANIAKLEESFEELTLEPVEFIDLDDKLVVVLSIAGRGRSGGASVDTTVTQLWTLRDGKAVSLRDFATKSAALEAAEGAAESR